MQQLMIHITTKDIATERICILLENLISKKVTSIQWTQGQGHKISRSLNLQKLKYHCFLQDFLSLNASLFLQTNSWAVSHSIFDILNVVH